MDPRPDRLTEPVPPRPEEPEHARPVQSPQTDGPARPDRLEGEVRQLRTELDDLVNELDRRRRRLLDWRGQLREHGTAFAIVGGAAALALGGALLLHAREQRRLRDPWVRLSNLSRVLAAVSLDPRALTSGRPARGILAPTAGALTTAALALTRVAAARRLRGAGRSRRMWRTRSRHRAAS